MYIIEFGCSIDAKMFNLCIRFNSNFLRIKKKKLTWIKNNLEKAVYNAIKILMKCLSLRMYFAVHQEKVKILNLFNFVLIFLR